MTRNDSVIGTIAVNFIPIGYTLELPWQNNQRYISHIPVGDYEAQIYDSSKFGEVLKLLNVPNRSDVLIHQGNYSRDTQGCILPGKKLGKDSVQQSRNAMREIINYINEIMFIDRLLGDRTYIRVIIR
jgi:hypothetical protein